MTVWRKDTCWLIHLPYTNATSTGNIFLWYLSQYTFSRSIHCSSYLTLTNIREEIMYSNNNNTTLWAKEGGEGHGRGLCSKLEQFCSEHSVPGAASCERGIMSKNINMRQRNPLKFKITFPNVLIGIKSQRSWNNWVKQSFTYFFLWKVPRDFIIPLCIK